MTAGSALLACRLYSTLVIYCTSLSAESCDQQEVFDVADVTACHAASFQYQGFDECHAQFDKDCVTFGVKRVFL